MTKKERLVDQYVKRGLCIGVPANKNDLHINDMYVTFYGEPIANMGYILEMDDKNGLDDEINRLKKETDEKFTEEELLFELLKENT